MYIVSTLVPLILFLIFVFVSASNYKKEEGERYDFLTHFPYEINGKTPSKSYLSAFLLGIFVLSLLILPITNIIMFRTMASVLSFLSLILVFALGVGLSMVLLFLTPASNEKAHIMYFVMFDAFLMLYSVTNGIFLLLYSEGYTMSVLIKIMGGFAFLVFVLALLILVNPKLKNWPALINVAEKDGTISYRRPRPFILAFSEWLLFLLSIILVIFIGIGNILFLI